MSNAHKIIKNFTSDKFSPELKEKLWKWLVDSSEQAEKDEALMELWEDQNFKADASTERSYQNFRRKIAPRQRKATARYTLRRWLQVAAVLLFPLLSMVASYLYIAYRFNWRTAKPLGPNTAPGCDEPTSRCQTSPSMWTLGGDQPVIPRVTFIR